MESLVGEITMLCGGLWEVNGWILCYDVITAKHIIAGKLINRTGQIFTQGMDEDRMINKLRESLFHTCVWEDFYLETNNSITKLTPALSYSHEIQYRVAEI